jgi:hypothetical protein
VIATDIRDGVIADFTAAGTAYFGTDWPFTPVPKWFETVNQTDGPLRVAILVDAQRTERIARKHLQTDTDLIVHCTAKLPVIGAELADTDGLTTVLQKMERYYYSQALRISGVPATQMSGQIQLPSRKQLKDGGRWYAWGRLTFRVIEKL